MHSSSVGFLIAALAGAAAASPYQEQDDLTLAPLVTPPPPPMGGPLSQFAIQSGRSPSDYLIKDHYIVVFKKDIHEKHARDHKHKVHKLWKQDRNERIQVQGFGIGDIFAGIKHHFDIGTSVFKGYSIHVPESLISIIRTLPEVAYVERDSKVWINDPYFATNTVPANEPKASSASDVDVEYGAPWGLARISHRHKLKFSTFNVYPFEDPAGKGVDVYVIDTGINIEHEELEGRAVWGKTIPQDADKDLNGHGSHVAGTIASRSYGVAKNATVIAVKVLGAGGSGTMSDVVAGVVWAAESALNKAKTESTKSDSKHKGSVANMSLGGGKSPSLDDAVNAAVETGLHFAVAAGNDNRDACTFSPAAAANPITVGASTIQDERAYFSNHGKCVDIFAPGLNINPHIAGLAAYFLSIYPESLDLAALGLQEDDDVEDEVVASNGEAYDLRQYFTWNSANSPGQIAFGKFKEAVGFGQAQKTRASRKPLSTTLLKKAMLKLSTPGALADLPAQTVNYLAYNNVTAT
ncbi:subtilase-type proteinase psp3 [Phakopsora pachyrhizi]|uniref:Subtilase-type proteinase psp3 n=1 Tax=Phakopsora pachyrhizi TaxID=170000 RepID=A0AAV0B8T6_PHAPC|nr:subtilase-type proteinase psp3 [Phakopsora pachyrhizi]